MDAKIALAAPGKLLTLYALDEDKIREFIVVRGGSIVIHNK